jgi:hypothetical protein
MIKVEVRLLSTFDDVKSKADFCRLEKKSLSFR